jgi:hypothetical protein
MATLTTEQVTSSGLNATANAATVTTGDKVRPGSILRIVNGGENPTTVTIDNPETRDVNLAVPDRTVAIPAGEARYVFASDYYRNKTDGLVKVTCNPVTSVTIEVVRA